MKILVISVLMLLFSKAYCQDFDFNVVLKEFIDNPVKVIIDPYNYIFLTEVYSHSDTFNLARQQELKQLYESIDVDTIHYKNGVSFCLMSIEDQYWLHEVNKDNKKVYKVLKIRPSFMLLCAENVDICDCGSEMKLLKGGEVKSLERTFTFSIKKDILHKLHKYGIIDESSKNVDEFCKTLKEL